MSSKLLRVQILHLLFELHWKHAELERRSSHQLRLKAVEMLYSSTQLAKNHGDDLSLECLWNEDEYDSLESSLKAMEKNAEYARRSRVKISANQRTLPSVLFLSLLFRRWLKAIHRVFHYVNLSNMCSKQTFHSTNLSNVGFFIASQSVRIYLSFQKKPITK